MMQLSSSRRFQLLLDLARWAIFGIDLFRNGIPALGSRLFPGRISQRIPVPSVGNAVHLLAGGRAVEAWSVQPATPRAAVLICHGVGDRLQFWRRAQALLAANGIASLVFHYAGYGQSQGGTTEVNLAADAGAAYQWLGASLPQTPVFLLGFSLGSGLVAEVAGTLQPPPAGIILSEAFTSLREASRRMGRALGFLCVLMPDVWRTSDNVTRLKVPLLIVHSTGDSLFPVAMADTIYRAAIEAHVPAELAILAGYRHNAPFLLVPADYWAAILGFIERNTPGGWV